MENLVRFFLPLFFFGPAIAGGDEVDFARDIRPILSAKCFFCHGPDEKERKAGLRLDVREEAFAERDGTVPIAPGDLDASELWARIISHEEDEIMPPPKAKKPLTAGEKSLIEQWIREGAPWSGHWSFVAPEKRETPGDIHPIDHFVRETLAAKGLEPSPEADRRTLIRRLSFDLTGLPPTPGEVSDFVNNPSPRAYGELVDRLLASKHFGERMALMWLDAARYGDTSVMHADGPRDMWPWRDWVVNAYNTNQPYDRFSIEQLAGDLLPDPTLSQKIATGFNRNHPSSDEGGAIPEELRVSYVADRVKTTANVWLGLTMECAQCHEHKYDPISQKEYYRFYAYFNNTTDPGMQTRKGNQVPVIEVVSPRDEQRLSELTTAIEGAGAEAEAARSKSLGEFTRRTAERDGDEKASPDAAAEFKNLRHFFPLNEPEGNLVCDVRSRKDGAAEHPIKSLPGRHGSSVGFDGQTTFLVPDFPEYDHRNKLTFSAWVKIDSDFTGAIFSKMDKSLNFRGYDFWMEQGRPGVHLINSWPKNAVKVLTERKLEKGKWQHVALTYDGSGKAENIRIYVDGESWTHAVQHGAKELKSTMKNEIPFRLGGRTGESYFRGQLDDVRIYDRVLKPEEIRWALADSIGEAFAVAPKNRRPEQTGILRENFLAEASPEYRLARGQFLSATLERIAITTGKTTTMIMADHPPEKMRPTYLLERGAYDAPNENEAIPPGTPAFLPPLPGDAPPDRLSLANWLFAPEHPLTSRVAVNQLWQLLFGTGIVSTPGDFGAQGDFPSHPELLDWLAVDFRESGWNVKRMIRQIVMSATYRQSSRVLPDHLRIDAGNRFLARAPRFRLPAEMIRDNALALSGLLVDEMGGPGVKPYQPPGLWAEVGLGGNPKFVQDHGEKLYRRSLYTYWKRSAPHPAMLIFDAPNRETCVLKRPNTNTPLQALAAMNDVQMLEASRHFAERVLRDAPGDAESRARFAFELATSREPTTGEVAAIIELLDSGAGKYGASPDQARAILAAGESKRDTSLDETEHAAWTLVASLILNLDEVLTRN